MAPDRDRPLRARLRDGLGDALKARDRVAVEALRSALGVIDNAEAVPLPDCAASPAQGPIAGALPGVGSGDVPRRGLDEDQIRELVAEEINQRRCLADEHERLARHEQARRLRSQASLLQAYL